MTSKQAKQIQRASLAISLSGLISKILAAIYRIPYQNLVGDRGFYAYQQIYPILAIISTLGLLAFPNLIASLAQKKGESNLQSLLWLELVTSLSLGAFLFFFANQLADFMGASDLAAAIRLTAFVFFLMPFISFYRGLAQADNDMKPTALSQVLEQTVRITIIILAALAYHFFDLTIYQTAFWASFASLAASFVTLLALMTNSSISLKPFLTKFSFSWQDIRNLGFPSLVFTLYAIYLLLFQLIDAFFVKNALTDFGLSDSLAEASKGVYDRGQPLIQFGLIFSTAFFTSHLPNLTRLFSRNKLAYKKESQSFFELIFYFNLTLTLGFMLLLGPMNQVLFEDRSGQSALLLYLILIFISSLVQFFHQKLFIENQHKKSFLFLLLGLLAKLLLTYPLTNVLGILGASLATVLSLFLPLIFYMLTSDIEFSSVLKAKYYLSLLAMLFVTGLVSFLLRDGNRLLQFFNLVLSAASGGLIFLFISKKWQIFPDKLWSYLPFYKEK